MIEKLALYALAPLTFAGSMLGLDATDEPPLQSHGATSRTAGGEMRIARAADGLFYVPVKIGERTVHMALDTGATRSVVPRGLLGPGALREQSMGGVIETLDGRVRFNRATIGDVRVGTKHFAEIEVALADVAFPAALLGQDLLRQLGPVTIDGDTLILR